MWPVTTCPAAKASYDGHVSASALPNGLTPPETEHGPTSRPSLPWVLSQGHSPGVKFPRVLGIEAAGIVEEAPGNEFAKV